VIFGLDSVVGEQTYRPKRQKISILPAILPCLCYGALTLPHLIEVLLFQIFEVSSPRLRLPIHRINIMTISRHSHSILVQAFKLL